MAIENIVTSKKFRRVTFVNIRLLIIKSYIMNSSREWSRSVDDYSR
jgi:hypothetical protein